MKLWPDAQETLLLTAALGDGAPALAAFRRWQNGVDWDAELDGGSFRLLPLLHANLVRLGCDDPLMGRLRGVYRHSWCEAQTHIRRGELAVAGLAGQGIPVLVSKGLVLATDCYASPALRPMSDIDLVVPSARALEAVDLLGQGGWLPLPAAAELWRGRSRDMLAMVNGIGLYHPHHGEIDLHWRLLQESGSDAADARFWQQALPFRIGAVAALRTSPTHLLFHVIAHGVRPNPMSPLRWIADAVTIVRRDRDRIDWDEMAACARRFRVGKRLAAGLDYLHETMALGVPRALPLRRSRIEWLEDRAFRATVGARPIVVRKALDLLATVARLAVGDARVHLPRLGLRWVGRRLNPLRLAR